ncbi:MAG TPA: hypothetical protein VK419_04800 [Bryobacteraceae bacterium]|nr:hypothetical protein [Bryobacteraceae bacterium]
MPIEPVQVIGGYEVIGLIGAGAFHRMHRSLVKAVKMLESGS